MSRGGLKLAGANTDVLIIVGTFEGVLELLSAQKSKIIEIELNRRKDASEAAGNFSNNQTPAAVCEGTHFSNLIFFIYPSRSKKIELSIVNEQAEL